MKGRLILALVIVGLVALAGAAWAIDGARRATAVVRGRGRRLADSRVYAPGSAAAGS